MPPYPLDGGGDVWHVPLRRALYDHEEERLLESLESCLGRGYDFIGAGRSGGGKLMRTLQRVTSRESMEFIFCSELVVWALASVGVMHAENASVWNPQRLVRHVIRRGICQRGKLLS